MGLMIVRALMESIGGHLEVVDTGNRGSEIHLLFPRHLVERSRAPPAPAELHRVRRALARRAEAQLGDGGQRHDDEAARLRPSASRRGSRRWWRDADGRWRWPGPCWRRPAPPGISCLMTAASSISLSRNTSRITCGTPMRTASLSPTVLPMVRESRNSRLRRFSSASTTLHAALILGEAAAHVVVDADIAGEAVEAPRQPLQQLAVRGADRQGVRPGIDLVAERLHRHMQHQLVPLGAGARRHVGDAVGIGHERQRDDAGQVDRQLGMAARDADIVEHDRDQRPPLRHGERDRVLEPRRIGAGIDRRRRDGRDLRRGRGRRNRRLGGLCRGLRFLAQRLGVRGRAAPARPPAARASAVRGASAAFAPASAPARR